MTSEIKNNTIVETNAVSVESLLKRAFMFLEDGDFKKADEYCERILDHDPEHAQAYLVKLMADMHVSSIEELQNCKKPFDTNVNYNKIVRFGDENIIAKLNGYIEQIKEQNERNEKDRQIKTNKIIKIVGFSIVALVGILVAIAIINNINKANIKANKVKSFDLTQILPVSWELARRDISKEWGHPDRILDGGNIFYYNGSFQNYSGEYKFYFDSNGMLKAMGFEFDKSSDASSYIRKFIQAYGEPDETNDLLSHSMWYGNVNGEEAHFYYEEADNGQKSKIEIDKKMN